MKQQVNWRRILWSYLLGGLFLIGLWLGFRSYLETTSVSLNSAAGPQLVVEHTRHDFGRVKAGTVLEHEFELVNKGSGRVVLNRKLCGSCTDKSSSSTAILSAGESMRFPVVITTDNRTGSLEETVTLTTSDPRRPKVELTVTAEIAGE
jgi:hypothetical protein